MSRDQIQNFEDDQGDLIVLNRAFGGQSDRLLHISMEIYCQGLTTGHRWSVADRKNLIVCVCGIK